MTKANLIGYLWAVLLGSQKTSHPWLVLVQQGGMKMDKETVKNMIMHNRKITRSETCDALMGSLEIFPFISAHIGRAWKMFLSTTVTAPSQIGLLQLLRQFSLFRSTTFVVVVLLLWNSLVASAYAGDWQYDLQPMQAYTVEMQERIAVVYFTETRNGLYEVVTTVAPKDTDGLPTRYVVVLSPDQGHSWTLAGAARTSIDLARFGNRLALKAGATATIATLPN